MRLIHTLLGSAICALALISSPLNAEVSDSLVTNCSEGCKSDGCKCGTKKPANFYNHCGKCDKKDGDKPETCPDKKPCCPKEASAPSAKCDKKDGDKPETCPDKTPCCPKE